MQKAPNPDPKRDPDAQTPDQKTPDPNTPDSTAPDSKVQGEGDYEAARRYRKDVEEFVEETGPDGIRKKAEDAEKAILGAEGEDLRRAEAEG
jgi:hypothetical protein